MSSDCKKCALHEGAINVCIGGLGKRTAPFLVVMQGPDSSEDLAGKLGSGRNTRLLIDLLKEAGFQGSEVRITSAVRCTTGYGRPKSEEINACKEYLRDEIHAVRPSAIVAVGDDSCNTLCRRSGVMSLRGKPLQLHAEFDLPSIEVWPVFSLGMLSKTPNYRGVIIEDLRRARNHALMPSSVHYVEGYGVTVPFGTISYDCETDYNYDTKTGGENVTQSSHSWRDDSGTIQTRVITVQPFGDVARHCRETGALLVTHNGWAFDLPKLGLGAVGRDTMCLAWLDDETQPKSLDALAAKYCGAVSWKQGKTAVLGTEEFRMYNARDVYYTLLLHEQLCLRLGDRVKIADRIILPAFIALQACSKRGIYVSQAKVREFTEKYTSEEADSLRTLQEYVGDIAPWCKNSKGVLAYKKPTKFNPSSPHQVSEWFTKEKIFTRFTDSGEYSSDAKALETADLPPGFRKPLETYRHAKKMLGTYLEPLTTLGEDGRLHPEYYQFPRVFAGGGEGGSTVSGRPTATLNVLTLPREMKRGGIYSAPRGSMLAEADYSGVEFRLCAWYARAKGILDNYAQNPEWDAHSWFARPFYGMPDDAVVEKSKRQVAKSANFSLWYCGYWKTMQEYAAKERIKLSQEDCERAYATWHALIPEAAPWWKSIEDFVKEHGYIETPTGRRRNFGKWEYVPKDMRGDVQREAVNMLAQSLSGDITYLALANCHEVGLPINHTWYDAIYFEIDKTTDKRGFEATVRECMITRPLQTLRDEFGVVLDVPLTVEISYREEG